LRRAEKLRTWSAVEVFPLSSPHEVRTAGTRTIVVIGTWSPVLDALNMVMTYPAMWVPNPPCVLHPGDAPGDFRFGYREFGVVASFSRASVSSTSSAGKPIAGPCRDGERGKVVEASPAVRRIAVLVDQAK
jgi:hypothetical protein